MEPLYSISKKKMLRYLKKKIQQNQTNNLRNLIQLIYFFVSHFDLFF